MTSYRLLSADGAVYESSAPGLFGGYRLRKIYGRLDCPSAARHLANGNYVKHRVFFANEEAAIAAKYRPCAKCLPERYRQWKQGGVLRSDLYPWLVGPKQPEHL